MKIYTKAGDSGETSLYGGTKVDKDSLRVEAYGTIDELNATLGAARSCGLHGEVDTLCATIQSALFVAGAELACPPEHRHKLKIAVIHDEDVGLLEAAIDRFTEELPPLAQFVLPGGTRGAATLHQARTICRRAERQVVTLKKQSEVSKDLLIFLNRLGDLLFVAARLENHRAKVPDVPWNPR
jgi:cob(I)alamin adenosyltransferase